MSIKNYILPLIFCVMGALFLHSPKAAASTPDFTSEFVSVADYIVSSSDDLDDTAGINQAILAAKHSGYKTLYFPVGTYIINGTLEALNDTFDMVSLVGENPRRTIIKLVAGSNFTAPMLQTVGGSGQMSFAKIQDLQFQGNSAATAIQLRGTGGVRIKDCIFKNVATGVEFSNNVGPGTFTTFSVAEDCSFESSCIIAIKFARGAGDRSFNGTGLRHCLISRSATNSQPSIQIGNPGESLDLFNAPLDFSVETRNNAEIMKVSSPNSAVQVTGDIRVENLSAGTQPVIVGGPAKVFLAGSILAWADVGLGHLVQVDAVKHNTDGTLSTISKQQHFSATLTAKLTKTSIAAGDLGSLVSVAITTSRGVYHHVLVINRRRDQQTGTVDLLSGPRSDQDAYTPGFWVHGDGSLMVEFGYELGSAEMKVVQIPLGGDLPVFWD